jgi:hypothetical protein
MWDSYGDGWNGSKITITVDGISFPDVTLASGSSGTATPLLPSGEVKFGWSSGSSWDSECSFKIYAPDGTEIYYCPTGSAGSLGALFLTYQSDCGGSTAYNIYRDGDLIEDSWPETEYLDITLDPLFPHEWCVRVACKPEGESMPTCASLPACGICEPIQDLTWVQPSEGVITFTWTIPNPLELPGYVGMRVLRDGVIIAPCLNQPICTYTDQVSVGWHNYCFIALYDKPECTESPQMCWNIEVIEQCDPVTNVTATIIGPAKVRVQWTGVTAITFVDYTVLRDGATIAEHITQTLYVDEGVPVGAHIYSVIANYNKSCTESDEAFSNEIVIETCEGVTDLKVTKQTIEEIVITWQHTDATTFDVYRDFVLLETVDALTYSDAGPFTEGVIYLYCVMPVYETCQVPPICVEAYIEPCVPQDVTNVVLVGDVDKKEIVVTWTYAGSGATFNVFRDNKLIANVATATYTDTNVEFDVIYKYCITPVHPTCPGGGTACNTTVITAIEETTTGLSIYPNPATTQVIIEGTVVNQIDIYNAIGQVIETIKFADTETTKFTVDLTGYESGAYIFKIRTSDNTTVTKPIVISRY